MSQSQRFDAQYEEPLPYSSAAGPTAGNGRDRPPSTPFDVGTRPVAKDQRVTTLILMVGLPGAGKTTRAKELAMTYHALRLTPDHWMIRYSASLWPTASASCWKGGSSRLPCRRFG
jgi:AAA domain